MESVFAVRCSQSDQETYYTFMVGLRAQAEAIHNMIRKLVVVEELLGPGQTAVYIGHDEMSIQVTLVINPGGDHDEIIELINSRVRQLGLWPNVQIAGDPAVHAEFRAITERVRSGGAGS